MPVNEQIQNFITELRRGSLTLAVLGCLKQPHYGYALLETMQKKQIDIEANTLYPLLRRLESQGLLKMERTILHSDPNNFYASVEILDHPELKGKPVAVCGDPELIHQNL